MGLSKLINDGQENRDTSSPTLKFKQLKNERTLILNDDPNRITSQIKFPKDLTIAIVDRDADYGILHKSVFEQAVLIKVESLTSVSHMIKSLLDMFDVVIISCMDTLYIPGDNSKRRRGSVIKGILAKVIRKVKEGNNTLIVTSSIKEHAAVDAVDKVVR